LNPLINQSEIKKKDNFTVEIKESGNDFIIEIGKEADKITYIFLNEKLIIELPKYEHNNRYYSKKNELH
jgi:hypothetical protein